MAKSRYKYYTEILRTITDYNNRNYAPLLNDKIRESIHKFIEEKLDAHNVTAYTFSHTSNTQRQNTNGILKSEKLDKSDELAETLKYLKINNAEYYVSNSVNTNDGKSDPASNPKTVTHTRDKYGKVTDNSNIIL